MMWRLLGVKGGDRLLESIQRRRIRQILWRWRPDVVHCHWVDEVAWAFARAGARNLVITAWGSDVNRFFDCAHPPAARRQVAEALQKCVLLTGDAEDIRLKAELLAGRKLSWLLFPLGIRAEQFRRDREAKRQQFRQRFRIPEATFLFGDFRAWRPDYRHAQILEAFAGACKACDSPLGLLIKVYYPDGAPRYHDLRSQIELRIAALQLQDRVWWVQGLESRELPSAYAAVDAVINWPQRDAMPVTFFEAAAARRPVITCWHPAYDVPLVRDNFLVVHEPCIDNLTQAMIRAREGVREGNLERSLIAAELEVEQTYSETASVLRLSQIYGGLLNASPNVMPPPAALCGDAH
jgi:glycosyltransferase involved in cell wall biosynthesis